MLYCLVPGCEREGQRSGSGAFGAAQSNEDLRLVRTVLAELLKINAESIEPQKTFADLHADELDLVETVMEIEDRLKVSITDEAIAKSAGSAEPDKLLNHLTVEQLARVVSEARRNR
jgi:acyl carrier protein